MSEPRTRVWAGVDAGKGHHWAAVVDETGATLWSKKIDNDESAILTALGEILDLAGEVHWAVDISGTSSALLLALLAAHGQQTVYVPGRTVTHMSGAYRGEAKTDARDAYVIAETARRRSDFATIDVPAQLAADLALLTAHRSDLVADRVRMTNRLRDVLTGVFPALERSFDYSNHKGALVLLTGYQTPGAIRRLGVRRLESWLKMRGVKSTASLARTAVEAAESQATTLPGEKIAADMAARIAKSVLALDAEIAELDALIVARFHDHPHAKVIETLPGMGPRLGAEFIAATGGDLTAFGTPDRLAGFAGLAPVPRDSGRVRGNLHRPRRYHRGLLRACYLAAMASLRCCPVSQRYYQRKRNEGKSHIQAVLALARRRLNVLWAMIRDNTSYELRPPIPTAA